MDHHLAGEEPGNRRNGYGKKRMITDTGQIEQEVPRDRQARFDRKRSLIRTLRGTTAMA
jgi:putative transposase